MISLAAIRRAAVLAGRTARTAAAAVRFAARNWRASLVVVVTFFGLGFDHDSPYDLVLPALALALLVWSGTQPPAAAGAGLPVPGAAA